MYFRHGAGLARAFVAGGPRTGANYAPFAEEDADRNRQWVIDAAHVLAQRVERVLGAGLPHAQAAPVG